MLELYNDLPKKLETYEETLLIQKNDERSKKVLIESNLRLVKIIAKKFLSSGEHFEDLVSIGTIGLIKGVNSFDPQRNFLLSTYLNKCIKNEILKHLKKYKKIKKEISIDEPIVTDKNGKSLALIDTLYNESDSLNDLIAIEIKNTLNKAIEILTENEKKVIHLRYNFDNDKVLSQRRVADIIGVSQAAIFQTERKAIKKLRKYLTDSF